jgi:phytoene desaturase
MLNCAVIGSGIAGLASAIRLKAKGNNVTIFEANDYAGGKLKEFHKDGYRFDMGPSVFTQPNLVDELFELHNKNPRDYFSYSKLEKSFKYFFEDGTRINAFSDKKLFENEIEEKTIDNKSSFRKYLKDIERKYEITNKVFIENSLHVPTNFLTKEAASGILNFNKIDAFKTMDKGNKSFFKDPKTIQIFNNYATYVGSNPFIAPATLNVIQHLEVNMGAYVPNKGMYSIVKSLVRLAIEVGVKIELNSLVSQITLLDGTANGVLVNQKERKFDRVISNMDVYYTFKKLLPSISVPKQIKQPKSSSVIGFYWSIDKVFKELETHNMLFSNSSKSEFDSLFNEKTINDDASIYLCITSKHINTDAPVGCENWFVMIHAPHIENQNWDELISKTRKNAVKKLNRILKTDIENHINNEAILSPVNIRDNYRSAFGAIYGNSSNSKFSTFLRHPNFSKRVKNLYFVGGTVHPGAGIPMCLNSAKIVDKLFK